MKKLYVQKKVFTIQRSFIIPFLVCLYLLSGCSSPYKSSRILPSVIFSEKNENAVNSQNPSWETRQFLRLMFLDKPYHKEHKPVIEAIEEMVRKEPTPELRTALAELALVEGKKYERSDPRKAEIYYMEAALESYGYLFSDARSLGSSPLIPSFRFMADIYNLALSKVIILQNAKKDPWQPKEFDYGGVHYSFEVEKNVPDTWDPKLFNYLYNSYELKITGLQNEYITKGLGAPLVGIVENPSENAAFGRFYPKRLCSYPISAVLLFDPITTTDTGSSRKIRLVFYDSLHVDSINIQNRNIPLEADFTKPLGLQLRNANPNKIGFRNLIKSDVELKNAGLYMQEPYRADKIPVVMVHGLLSSPITWAPIFNDLRGDPQLRKRYQFWFFMYPTGLPIGYSASILRKQLNEARAYFDPNGTNENFNQMVLVGHSMGGLLSRLMVQDSGTACWDYYFKEPFDTINIDPNSKQMLKDSLFFEHLPFVKRVIFISTPHRGSTMADEWYTKMFSGMVELPGNISDVTKRVIPSGTLSQHASSTFTKRAPNSLTLLSPGSAFIKMTNTVPLRSDIPYNSIIGVRRSKIGPGSSDGVVAYESSHLDFAESEKLVPSGHGAQEHPLAIAEVKRILYEHAKIKNLYDKKTN